MREPVVGGELTLIKKYKRPEPRLARPGWHPHPPPSVLLLQLHPSKQGKGGGEGFANTCKSWMESQPPIDPRWGPQLSLLPHLMISVHNYTRSSQLSCLLFLPPLHKNEFLFHFLGLALVPRQEGYCV